MNSNDDSTDPTAPLGPTVTAKAAGNIKDGIDSANDAADKAVDALASKAQSVRHEVTPKIKQGVDRAQTLIDQGVQTVRDTTQAARDKASDVTDVVLAYTRDEPVKALLIAAAAGAVLMSLLSTMTRPRG